MLCVRRLVVDVIADSFKCFEIGWRRDSFTGMLCVVSVCCNEIENVGSDSRPHDKEIRRIKIRAMRVLTGEGNLCGTP
jgi:hypothetical protein